MNRKERRARGKVKPIKVWICGCDPGFCRATLLETDGDDKSEAALAVHSLARVLRAHRHIAKQRALTTLHKVATSAGAGTTTVYSPDAAIDFREGRARLESALQALAEQIEE